MLILYEKQGKGIALLRNNIEAMIDMLNYFIVIAVIEEQIRTCSRCATQQCFASPYLNGCKNLSAMD